jgi:hypothetical protein
MFRLHTRYEHVPASLGLSECTVVPAEILFINTRVLARDAEHWRYGFHLYLSVNLLCYDPGNYCINMYKFSVFEPCDARDDANYIFPSIKSSCRCGVSAGSVYPVEASIKKGIQAAQHQVTSGN